MDLSRRSFLGGAASLAATAAVRNACTAGEEDRKPPALAKEVGITTSSLSGHLVGQPARGKFTLLELPRLLRDELDLRVIDLNTSTLASFEPKYLDQVRKAADDAGCVLTNLKLNQRGLDMSSPNRAARQRALAEYKRSIEAAGRLGLRWARPLPTAQRPDPEVHVASYRELADFAAERKVQMLVENYGWMEADPRSVVRLVEAVGRNVAACPDTGNWASNAVRYEGLKLTFPKAATCDFKARQLGPDGSHDAYDLRRCFTIGWEAGFRGPWCLEHANPDRTVLFRELALLRDLLRQWMRDQEKH
jgi:hypothetical protein